MQQQQAAGLHSVKKAQHLPVTPDTSTKLCVPQGLPATCQNNKLIHFLIVLAVFNSSIPFQLPHTTESPDRRHGAPPCDTVCHRAAGVAVSAQRLAFSGWISPLPDRAKPPLWPSGGCGRGFACRRVLLIFLLGGVETWRCQGPTKIPSEVG